MLVNKNFQYFFEMVLKQNFKLPRKILIKGKQYIQSTFQTLSSVINTYIKFHLLVFFLGNLKFYYFSTLLQYIYFNAYILLIYFQAKQTSFITTFSFKVIIKPFSFSITKHPNGLTYLQFVNKDYNYDNDYFND